MSYQYLHMHEGVQHCNRLRTNQPTNEPTNKSSTEEIPSWEANSSSASQEIHHNLLNLKVHYRVLKSPPLDLSSAS